MLPPPVDSHPPPAKKKRNLPGNPDPDAEVIALSPKTLMATNRFLCEICGKGFQRDQNLQLHRRGHNLPWKLRQRSSKETRKRVYVCPEKSCVHHHPSRALGDLTGIKKHYCRKHGEKKWKCDKCSKRYAVQSDWKAHAKTCGTREYRCDCGTPFSRRDSFTTHRAFCDALAEETARVTAASNFSNAAAYQIIGNSSRSPTMVQHFSSIFSPNNGGVDQIQSRPGLSLWMNSSTLYSDLFASTQTDYQPTWGYAGKVSGEQATTSLPNGKDSGGHPSASASAPSLYSHQHLANPQPPPPDMSATALLQKAAQLGASSSADKAFLGMKGSSLLLPPAHLQAQPSFGSNNHPSATSTLPMAKNPAKIHSDDLERAQTRDFLGVGMQTLCPPSIHGWI